MLLVSVGILVLALVSSLLTAWVTSKNSRQQLIDQGLQLTQSFAEQSVLALLFESAENAEDLVASTLSFPNVMYVKLLTHDGKMLLHEGDDSVDKLKNIQANVRGRLGFEGSFQAPLEGRTLHPESLLPVPSTEQAPRKRRGRMPEVVEQGAVLLCETDIYLCFRAPVFDRQADEQIVAFIGSDQAPNLLGFADIVMSKAELNSQRITTILQYTLVSFVLAIIILLVLQKILSRIVTPLSELSALMHKQDVGEKTSRAKIRGPVEIRDMAHAFNSMMDVLDERDLRLRNQNDNLENKIKERTRDLRDARDAAIQASKHKSAFLANMSHELRTPMNSVLGYTSMVLEDARSDHFNLATCVEDLSRVDNAGKHLLSMINNILDLAKIEAGRMELECGTVDIKQLAGQVEDSVLPLITDKNNKLVVDVVSDVSSLSMDAVKLRQILINLLSNAAKFTEQGTITLKIEHSIDALFCSVVDTGMGMDEEQQQRIFQAFKQGNMTTTKEFGGTGLGLTISQHLCALMGGTIKVKSDLGKGSALYFTLPLPLQEHQSEEAQLVGLVGKYRLPEERALSS
ncbi:MAG: HAMP domain-containing protein [Gammaproteobacteria bacterium]|nr:HAMP domain-containing protein [Gammaproteobacteria bacterium]